VFLLTWLLAMIGVQTFLNLMPLVMREAFGVEPSTTAWLYLAGSVVGVVLYPVCGRIAERRTVRFVLAIGLVANLIAFTLMAADLLLSEGSRGALAAVALVSVAIAYPFDYIGATLMAAVLATDGGEGAAMGLFNCGVAAGAVIGILAASPLAKSIGYEAIPPLAAVMLFLALLVGARLLFGRPRATLPSVPRGGELDEQVLQAAQHEARLVLERVRRVQREVVPSRRQPFECDRRLEPRQRGTDAEVDTQAEREMVTYVRPARVEPIWVGEH